MFSGLKIGKSSQDRNYSRQESLRLAGSGARPEAGRNHLHCLTCLCVIKLPRPYNTAVRQAIRY